jgi:hypothetical protein
MYVIIYLKGVIFKVIYFPFDSFFGDFVLVVYGIIVHDVSLFHEIIPDN